MNRTSMALCLSLLAACAAPRTLDGVVRGPVAVDAAAGRELEPNWKERLPQPYVYLEHHGDYRRMGDTMRALFAAAESLELEPAGAPFALFFDDPGRVPAADLRARACLPVAERPSKVGGLAYDVLPRAMVVYGRVSGAYPEVARTYPSLFRYLRDLGWAQGGPIREVYLVNPVEAASYDELLTEVQIPWTAGASR